MMQRAVFFLFLAGGLFAQDAAFDRVKSEAAHAKRLSTEEKNPVAQVAKLHAALRDWIEDHLPADKSSMAGWSNIEAGLQAQLRIAGLTGDVSDDDDITFGYAEVEFRQFPELPDTLLVIAGASIPACGFDHAVYGYQFGEKRTRTLEFHPGGMDNPELQLSAPDAQGRRVLLVHGNSVQCQSTWMNVSYSAWRFGILPGAPEKLLSVHHGFWFGNQDGPEYHLEPDGLVVEYLDASVNAIVHNRTQVYRYFFADGVTRADPVALQPQDFVEEWLTRPWEEMQGRSLAETKGTYEALHGDYVWANYLEAGPCPGQAGLSLVHLAVSNVGGKALEPPAQRFFLVRELGQYRYRMESVADAAPANCPVEGQTSLRHPWLPPAEIWNLPR